MTETTEKPHHPLPKDERARHDLLPEEIENEREQGDDDPEAPRADPSEPPRRSYRDPQGKEYQS